MSGNTRKSSDHWLGSGLLQGSLNYLFGGHQTMEMYGKFEGFPINSALFGLVI